MNVLCNDEIHQELILLGKECCDFCDELLIKHTVKNIPCCDNQTLINDDGRILCWNCGIIDRYGIAKEYIDYHENKYKFWRKSIYHLKYHIMNKLDSLSCKYFFSFHLMIVKR